MKFEKGKVANPAGRPKGAVNKTTASVKEAFKAAFDDLGGAAALVEWAKGNPTDFYKLASKLIPTELAGTVAIESKSKEELKEELERLRAKDAVK